MSADGFLGAVFGITVGIIIVSLVFAAVMP